MKYLKTYENMKYNFKVGDHIICIKNDYKDAFSGRKKIAKKGKIYEVLKIYNKSYKKINIIMLYPYDDEILMNIKDINTGKIIKGAHYKKYLSEIEYNSNKYNL